MPATRALLAELAERGELPPAQGRFVATEESEEAEYAALTEAAAASAAMLGASGRRVVIVADLAEPDGVLTAVQVVAVHADTGDIDPVSDDPPELAWFAVQEIEELLASGD